jgi:hypothetical protein
VGRHSEACSFLKPNTVKREKVKYTFDVSKCDKLFDVLVQGGMIKLKDGYVIPPLSCWVRSIVNGMIPPHTQLMNVITSIDRYNQH